MNFPRFVLARCQSLFDSVGRLRRWRELLLSLLLLCGALLGSPAHAEPALEWGLCPDGQEQVSGACFDKCKPGYYKVGLACVKACPDNFVDTGFACTNLDIRTKDILPRQLDAPGCPANNDLFALLCYPQCPAGWAGVGNMCLGLCPAGTDLDTGLLCTQYPRGSSKGWWIFSWWSIDSWGWTVAKPISWRSTSFPTTCQPGSTFVAGSCMSNCPAKFQPVLAVATRIETPFCSSICEPGWNDGEYVCQKDNSFIKEDLGSMLPRGLVNLCPDRDRDLEYPIVLVHGIFGYDVISALNWVPLPIQEYWQDVVPRLKSGNHGAKHVFNVTVSGISSNVIRAQQLLEKIAEIKKQTGKSRVHIYGHSLGSITGRMAANFDPSSIASVTSIAGANYEQGMGTVLSRVAYATWWVPTDNPPSSAAEEELEGNWVVRSFDLAQGIWSVLTYGDYNYYPRNAYLLAKEIGNTESFSITNHIAPWGLPSYEKGVGDSWESPLAFINPFDTTKFTALKLAYAQSLGKKSFEELTRDQVRFFFKGQPGADDKPTMNPYPRFNKQFPVLYYSWGGEGPFFPAGIATPIYATLQGMIFGATGESSDGMVDKRGAKLGKFIGYYNQDHLTSANVGVSSQPNLWFLVGAAHPISLMCEQAVRLKKAETDILKVGAGGPGLEPQWRPVTTNDHGRPDFAPVMVSTVPTPIPFSVQSSVVSASAAPQTMQQRLLAKSAAAVPSAALASTATAKPWQWQCLAGFNAPVRLSDTLDPQCLSSDGKNCSVQASPQACQSLVVKMNAPKPPAMTFAGCGAYAKGSTLDLVTGAWCRNTRELLNDWKCLEGVNTPVRKSSSNEVQCLSTDGSQCATANNLESCAALVGNQLRSAKTLSCGEQYKKLYGQTGYDNPGHWCAKGRSDLPN